MKAPEAASMEVDELPAPVRGLAVGSFGMAFFSFLVWWWIPFGICLATAASIMACISIALGVRTVDRGLYFPLGALGLASIVIPTAILTAKFTHLLFFEF